MTNSLGNDEHSGRTRGQPKFVRQSQYFNIIPSSKDNTEVSVVKRQLVALGKTVQEICGKHSIDRETMDEKNTALTINQHNSFKTSYTLNEKEPGVLD